MASPLDVEKLVAWLRSAHCGASSVVADSIERGDFALPALPCGHPAACAVGAVCGWCAEVDALKDTNKRLNRRCQSAEAGLAAKLQSGPCFGRALANAAATMYHAQLADAQKVVEAAIVLEARGGADALDALFKAVRAMEAHDGS